MRLHRSSLKWVLLAAVVLVASLTPVAFASTYSYVSQWTYGFNSPEGIAFNGNYVYVADTWNNRIVKGFRNFGSGQAPSVWTPGLDTPAAIASDPYGTYFYVAEIGGYVTKLDSSGRIVARWSKPTTSTATANFNGPYGIAVSPDGYVYVADSGNDRVVKMTTSGNLVAEWSSWPASGTVPAGSMVFPVGICADSSGNVYVADNFHAQVVKFSKPGQASRIITASPDFDNPSGLALDGQDNLVVADTNNNRLVTFDPNGNLLDKWGASTLYLPEGIASDGSYAYVADTAHSRVVKAARVTGTAESNPPTTTSDIRSGWYTTAPLITLNATDTSGVEATYYSTDGNFPRLDYIEPVQLYEDGIVDFKYYSVDNYGNAEDVKTQQVKVDQTAPVTTCNAATSYVESATITLSATDTVSGLVGTRWRLDGSAWTTGTSIFTNVIDSHVLEYQSKDVAGNWEATKTAAFTVTPFGTRYEETDSHILYKGTWKTETYTAGADGYSGTTQRWTHGADGIATIAFHGTSISVLSSKNFDRGIMYISLDNSAAVEVDQYAASRLCKQKIWSAVNLANTDHTVRVSWSGNKNAASTETYVALDAVDIVGNIIDAPDTTPPTSSSNITADWLSAPKSVVLTATDDLSGVANITYSIDGGAWTAYTGPFTISKPGASVVEFYARDNANNTENFKTATVYIDTIAPSTTATAPAGWVAPPAVVQLSGSDSLSGIKDTYYRISGGPWTKTAGTVAVSAEGTSVLNYYSVDIAGNVEATKTATVYVDGTAPSTLSDVQTSYIETATVHFTPSDTVSGVSSTNWRLDGGSWNTGTSFTIAGPTMYGAHTLEFYTVDVAGNREATQTAAFLVSALDNDPPVTTCDAPSGWASGPLTVTVQAQDAITGVAWTKYSLNGGAATDYTQPLTISDEGTSTLTMWSGDTRGNIETPTTALIRIDDTAPTTHETVPSGWVKSPAVVSFTAEDALSGATATTYRLGAYNDALYDGPFYVWAEGATPITYWSVDAAGNEEVPQTSVVYVDDTPPTTTDDAPSGWVTGTVDVHLASSDSLSGSSVIRYSIDGGDAQEYGASIPVSKDGTTTISYWATDNAGNTETPKTATVRIDNGAPTTSDDAPSGWVNGPVALHLTADDDVSSIASTTYRLNGGAPTTYSGAIQIAAEGPTTITYWSTDAAGNVESPKTTTVHVDDTTPITSADAPEGWVQGPVSVHLTATDDVSSVSSTKYVVGDGPEMQYTGDPIVVSAEGSTEITFWSEDAAGNVETAKSATVRIDNASATTTDDAPTAWVNGPVALHLSATDDRSGISAITYRVDDGPEMTYTDSVQLTSEGTSTITYWSTDAAGNVESPKTTTVRIDDTAPSTTSDAPTGWTSGSQVSVTLNAGDTLSSVAWTKYRVDSGPIMTYSGDPIVLEAQGATTLTYWSADVAGNVEAVHTAAVYLDAAAPGTTDDAPTKWVRGPVATHLSATDAVSSVAWTRYRLNGGTLSDYASSIAVTAEGTNTIDYFSADLAGNVEATKTAAVRIDNTAPSTTSDAPKGWQRQGVLVSLSANDALSGIAETDYRVAGGQTTAYSGTPIAVSAEGTTVIAFASVDAAGNAEATQTAAILVDTQAPTSSVNAQASYVGTASITISATDTLSGIASTTWRLDGGDWQTGASVNTTTPGHHTLEYYATDVAGNAEAVKTAAFELLRRIDSTDSRILYLGGTWMTHTSPSHYGGSMRYAPSSPATATLVFKGTGFDWLAYKASPYGIAAVSVDGSLKATVDLYSASGKYQQTVYSLRGLADTTHTVSIVRSGSQNASATGANIDIDAIDVLGDLVVDTEAPDTTSNAPTDWRSSPVTITLSPTDLRGSGVAATYYRVGNGSTLTYGAPFAVSAEGTTVVAFWSTDQAGNTEATKTATVRIDKTGPTSDATGPSGWAKGSAVVGLSGSDAASGLDHFLYSTDGSAPSVVSSGSVTVSSDGTTTVRYAAVDAVGNVGAVRTIVVQVDGTAPVSSATQPSSGWVTAASGLRLSATDANSGVAAILYRVDGSTPATYTSPVATADGTHTVTYWAIDNVGNTETTRSVTVRGDNVAPVTTTNATASYYTTATVTVTATDSLSGIAGTAWRLDGGAWQSSPSVTTTMPGQHTLDYYSTDVAGNVEATGTTSFVVLSRIDSADSRILYLGGNWLTHSSTNHYGGSMRYGQAQPAWATFYFKGTGFDWLAYKAAPYGIANVKVDGVVKATVDLYSSTAKYQQLVYQLRGLSDTTHAVTIERSGSQNASATGANVSIDAFDVGGTVISDTKAPVSTTNGLSSYSSTATISITATDDLSGVAATKWRLDGSSWYTSSTVTIATPGEHHLEYYSVDQAGNTETTRTLDFEILKRFEEKDVKFVYEGADWLTHTSSQDSSGTMMYAQTSPALVTFAFKGTGFDWIAYKAQPYGIATITVDSTSTTVSLYSATTKYQQVVYHVRGLADTTHTVSIQRTGRHEASATADNIDMDAVDCAGNLVYDRIALDHVSPTTTCDAKPTYSSAATITLSPVDTMSGVAYTRWRLDSGAWTTGTTIPVPTDIGAHTLDYYTVDNAKLTEPTKSVSFDVMRRYDQTDGRIVFTGPNWLTHSSGSHSGGSMYYVQSAPASITAVFKGTGFDWVGYKASAYGLGRVIVDGVVRGTPDLYSASGKYQQTIFGLRGLTDTTHTVVMEFAGLKNASAVGANVDMDAFDVIGSLLDPVAVDVTAPTTSASASGEYFADASIALAGADDLAGVSHTHWRVDGGTWTTGTVAAVPFSVGSHTLDYYSVDRAGNAETPKSVTFEMLRMVDQSDSGLHLLGDKWTLHTSASHFGGTMMYAPAGSASASFTFNGTGFDWFAYKASAYGVARVTVDGAWAADVDLYSATTKYRQEVYQLRGLAAGTHTVTIEYTGEKNDAALGANVDVDSIAVLGTMQ